MSTRRIIIGKRANGNKGVFISPVGVDAYTALDASLVLGIGGALSQLVMMGRVGAGSTVIPLGFSHSPYVFISNRTGLNVSYSGIIDGVMRPSPSSQLVDNGDGSLTLFINSPSYATVNSNGISMTITCNNSSTNYQVYNRAWT